MKKKYKVIVNDIVVKEYPYKELALTYCLLNSYVYHGYDEWFPYKEIVVLDPKVRIEEQDVEVDSESNV